MTVLQVLVFYFVRCVLAFSCCVCELYFYKWVYTPSTPAHTFGADYADKGLTGCSFCLSDTGQFVRSLVYTWAAWCWHSWSWARGCSARQQVGGHLLPVVDWGTFLWSILFWRSFFVFVLLSPQHSCLLPSACTLRWSPWRDGFRTQHRWPLWVWRVVSLSDGLSQLWSGRLVNLSAISMTVRFPGHNWSDPS